MKLTQRLSLKLRLTLLLLLSLAARFIASVVAWHQTTDKLDKLFDTQQMLFAKRLLTMDVDELRAPERMREVPKKPNTAIWTTMRWPSQSSPPTAAWCLTTAKRARHTYLYRRDGFDDGRLQDDNDEWRFLWLTSPDGNTAWWLARSGSTDRDMALDAVSSRS